MFAPATLLVAILLAAPPQTAAADTVVQRFSSPPGFARVTLDAGGFGAFLRALPLKRPGAAVHLYDGRRKEDQSVHLAVFDIDVGAGDLQQCADAVMRLRAEYLLASGRGDQICFRFTSGDPAWWHRWREGYRPVVRGDVVSWKKTARGDASYPSFRRYLRSVFTYAGTASLQAELRPVTDPRAVMPGDVFIRGGFPGHAVLVVDVAANPAGARRILLAQSYLPAQEIHLLKNPRSPSAWYEARRGGPLVTPEWRFDYADLRRFGDIGCAP